MDESLATLHFYFGALGGDPLSRMALGFRHLQGVGVPESCMAGVAYYQPVAEQVRGARPMRACCVCPQGRGAGAGG